MKTQTRDFLTLGRLNKLRKIVLFYADGTPEASWGSQSTKNAQGAKNQQKTHTLRAIQRPRTKELIHELIYCRQKPTANFSHVDFLSH